MTCLLCVTHQESHKQMDEDAEIEAELQRQDELEDARNNMDIPIAKDKVGETTVVA